MNLPTHIKKNRFLILGAIISVIILVFFFTNYNKSKVQEEAKQQLEAASARAIQDIADIAPFSNDFMTVFYFPKVESFEILVNNPFDQNKQKAITWLEQHQVRNICDMKIEFKAYNDEGTTFRQLTKAQKNTPGCPHIY